MPFVSRTQNAARQWIPTFATAFTLPCSVQAVDRSAYKELGLDLQKNYLRIFAAKDIIDLTRDASGDRFVYNSKLYQIESQKPWFLIDGWAACIAVEVGAAS